MATSVAMPTTIVMPMIEVMFSSVRVSHKPMNTAACTSIVVNSMAAATRRFS